MLVQHDIKHFDALTIVSPMQHGGESKDQDRAHWYASAGVACVADGVTSSPYSAAAAQLVCDFSPVLFRGDMGERLRAVAELLISRRLEAQQAEITLPEATPPSMIALLEEAARQRLTAAFQTTLAAVALTPAEDRTLASIVLCGDSALFAFSPHGELLLALPSFASEPEHAATSDDPTGGMRFGPRDELLAKIVGRASDDPQVADRAGIHPRSAERWLICQPIDQDVTAVATPTPRPRSAAMMLTRCDRLLVPQHLIGSAFQRDVGGYVRLRYASLIRRLDAPAGEPTLSGKGAVTAVVPDHVLSGRWLHRQESFPQDTHFVVCTDGFYENFNRTSELWEWLVSHESPLLDDAQRRGVLRDLHAHLDARSGDDDLSFVWVRPGDWVNSIPVETATEAHR